ncbi:MAG: hypothetical protein AAFY88_32160, partial [Acidobacteriota bacterium]
MLTVEILELGEVEARWRPTDRLEPEPSGGLLEALEGSLLRRGTAPLSEPVRDRLKHAMAGLK